MKPESTEPIKVIIADDHVLYRAGVKTALSTKKDIKVIAEADNGMHLLNLIKNIPVDVILLDIQMPGLDGAQVAAAVVRDQLPTRVLLLSAHDESAVVYQAIQDGAAGFLPKESTRADIVAAVLNCARGRDVISPTLAAGLAGEIRRRAEPSGPRHRRPSNRQSAAAIYKDCICGGHDDRTGRRDIAKPGCGNDLYNRNVGRDCEIGHMNIPI